jgi:hypothetical protein
LEIDRFEYGWDEKGTSALGGINGGALVRENNRTEKIPFHGVFDFYTHNKNDEWVEFYAKFTNGKLEEITKAPL